MSIVKATASPDDLTREVMRMATERGIRHIPVLDGETVIALVSVGDLLKARLAEKIEENDVLQDLARCGWALRADARMLRLTGRQRPGRLDQTARVLAFPSPQGRF
ncbi:MAG TPA: CBS domain-containing protein [Caulobacteraceae bacterium]|jgi:signal-transduction protein with cAMP-binding, CBS, and nucleotidyltransferase domain|nr:CBS domain-containing protein [Caulobacteraceae bacterium]